MNKFSWLKLSVLAFTFAPFNARAQTSSSPKISLAYSLQLVKSVALPDVHGTASEIAFSGNGKIAGVKVGGKLFTFDAKTWKLLHVFTPNFEPTLNQWALSPDGKTVALVHYKRDNSWSSRSGITLEIRNARTGQLRQALFQSDMPNYVAYSPDGKNLVTMSNYRSLDSNQAEYHGETKTIGCWNAKTGRLKWSSYSHQPFVNGVNDVNRLMYISMDSGFTFISCGLAFSPDGKTLASEFNGQVELRAMNSGEKKVTIIDKLGAEASLFFSADGKTLATGGDIDGSQTYDESGFGGMTMEGNGVKLWDTRTGKKLKQIDWDNAYTNLKETIISYNYSPLGFWPTKTTLAVDFYDSSMNNRNHVAMFGLNPIHKNIDYDLGDIDFNHIFTITPDRKFLVVMSSKDNSVNLEYWKARLN